MICCLLAFYQYRKCEQIFLQYYFREVSKFNFIGKGLCLLTGIAIAAVLIFLLIRCISVFTEKWIKKLQNYSMIYTEIDRSIMLVMISTHIVSDVEYIADTILMMKSGKLLLRGSVEMVTDSMQGKVWKYVAGKKEIERINEHFCVANLHHLDDGRVEVRMISDSQPFEGAVLVEPVLEDLYLYHFQNQ